MKPRIALFLLMCGMLLTAKTQQQCVSECKAKCTAALNSCKAKAKSKAQIQSCERSSGICSQNCYDKVCSGYASGSGKK